MKEKVNEDHKIISVPSLLQIGYYLFGILFSLGLTYLIYSSKSNPNEDQNEVVKGVIVFIFLSMALACTYMLLRSKKIVLTNKNLILSYPLLFYSKKIEFKNIKKVTEDNYKIESSHNFSQIDIYRGLKITIEFFDSKKIVINSMEITNYNLMSKNLKNTTRPYFKIVLQDKSQKNFQGYGCLLVLVILTSGLLISLF